jgi:hypothetical protein
VNNPKVALMRVADSARQMSYHENQIRIKANEILGLVAQVLEWLEAWDEPPEPEECEQLRLPGIDWDQYERRE